MTAAPRLPSAPPRVDPRSASTALLLAVIFFTAVFPTLRWQEFSNTTEGLQVATALEIRRTGDWMIPTLQGEPRIAKPPLPAWLTAATIPGETLEAISSADRERRARGFASLATIVRTITLLCVAGTLLATFAWGKLLLGDDVGLVSLIIAGTSLLTLRFCRLSTTDPPLALFVTLTNALLCLGALHGRWSAALLGGGATLAAAMMCKGPVCLLQTLVPLGVFALLAPRRSGPPWRSLLAGAGIFVALGVAWYALVLVRVPHAPQLWAGELSGHAEVEKHRAPWFTYLLLVPYLAPWVIFFIGSILASARRWEPVDRLLLSLIVVPVVLMSLSPDRYERYLLPMIPPCAILIARFVAAHVQARRWSGWDRLLNGLHWLLVGTLAVGLPLAGAYSQHCRTIKAEPWWSAATAWQAAAFATVVIAVSVLLQRRKPTLLILATAVLMLAAQSLFMAGYVKSEPARADFRPLADAIWALAPDARLFHTDPKGRRAPIDLSIYLNRSIPLVSGIADIPPGDGPRGLLVPQGNNDPAPTVPPGWTTVANRPRDNKRWWLLLDNATTRPSVGKIPIP